MQSRLRPQDDDDDTTPQFFVSQNFHISAYLGSLKLGVAEFLTFYLRNVKKSKNFDIASSRYTHFFGRGRVKNTKSVYFWPNYCAIDAIMGVLTMFFEIVMLKPVTGPNFRQKYWFLAILGFSHFLWIQNLTNWPDLRYSQNLAENGPKCVENCCKA